MFTKDCTRPTVPIAIGPQGLSAWSWVRAYVGKWFTGLAGKGIRPIIRSGCGFWPLFNGF